MKTKAVILAAGRGSRMREKTRNRPKCLVKLAGKPLLHWQLDALRQAGVDEILVVRGYLKESLVGGFSTMDNPRWAQSNMVVSLLCAEEWLMESHCVVSYSDIVYHPGHVKALVAGQGDILLTYDQLWEPLWRLRFDDPLGDAETFRQENGVLREIGGKASQVEEIAGQYMGLMRFTPDGFQKVRDVLAPLPQDQVDRLDMTALFAKMLEKGHDLRTVAVRGGWCEVDSQADLERYEEIISSEEEKKVKWSHDWRA